MRVTVSEPVSFILIYFTTTPSPLIFFSSSTSPSSSKLPPLPLPLSALPPHNLDKRPPITQHNLPAHLRHKPHPLPLPLLLTSPPHLRPQRNPRQHRRREP